MIKKASIHFLKSILGISKLEKMYSTHREEITKIGIWPTAIKYMNISINVHADELNHIPATGPTVVIANHPFGGADGIVLSYIVEQRRKDFKIFVTNIISEYAPEAEKYFLNVELYNKKTENSDALQQAIDFVKDGGCLIIFPAGTPSQSKTFFGKAKDLEWRSGASKIIHASRAAVVPVFFEGQNSRFFLIIGHLFRNTKSIRSLFLGRELLKKINSTVQVKIGSNISYSVLEKFDITQTTAHLRARVYMLRKPSALKAPQKLVQISKNLIPHKFRKSNQVHTIIDPIPTNKIIDFLESYKKQDPESILIESTRYTVMLIDGSVASEDFLLELGRLREITFRAVGEGTGKRCDLDEHDSIYHHLIVWSEKKQMIAGSYRLGLSPYVLKARGIRGFYTQAFFNFQKDFLDTLGDSIELGRSFVVQDEQSQWTLFFLWKGIAKFFSRNPNYMHLFGSVSISKDYSDRSRQLISKYFMKHHYDDCDLNRFVSAAIPYDYKSDLSRKDVDLILETIPNPNILSKVVADLEVNLKEVPVLVYRYAELGARYLTFMVDPDFGYTLDGFIVVPIKKIPREQLKKYISDEEVSTVLDS